MSKKINIIIVTKKNIGFLDLKENLEKKLSVPVQFSNKLDLLNSDLEGFNIYILNADDGENKIILKNINEHLQNFEKIFIITKNFLHFQDQKNIKLITLPLDLKNFLNDISTQIKILKQKKFVNQKNFKYSNQESKLYFKKTQNTVKLTEMENRFFNFLLNSKKPITKKEILKKVWYHQKELNTHTLETLVYRLRHKIEFNPKKPKILILDKNKYYINKT
tara:strand:- start:1104 stop:1763 length:660 start_codon:yes stop_codon:yes gene_type:complete